MSLSSWSLDLTAFKSFVNYTKSGTGDDATLTMMAAVGVDEVEKLCGPILTTTISEKIRLAGPVLPLSYRASSLLSLTFYPWGTSQNVSENEVDGQTLRRLDRFWIPGPLSVSYLSGEDQVPAWATLAASIIGRNAWRNMLRASGADQSGSTVPLVTPDAEKLMEYHTLAPEGIA
jgi:hypothetical protein